MSLASESRERAPSERPVRSPALRQFTAAEFDARNVLAQRGRHCALDLGDGRWHVSLQPLNERGPLFADEGQWSLHVTWAGAHFELLLPGAAAQAWIDGTFPQLGMPLLPDAYAAAVMEAACARLLNLLSAAGRGAARLERVTRGPGQGQALPHVVAFELSSDGPAVRGLLSTDTFGLLLIAGLIVSRDAAANRLVTAAVPIVLRAEVGFTWLSMAQLQTLVQGDVVLIEEVLLSQSGELWLGQGEWGFRVHWNDTSLTVTTAVSKEGWTMPLDLEVNSRTRSLGALADLPLRLAFDLGERSMSLGELEHLQPGQTLELGRPLSSLVSLRVNGALMGTGELVEVDGRLAVCINSLFAAAAALPQVLPTEAAGMHIDAHGDGDGDDRYEIDEADEE